jgi:AhpD family alkylhydroperoxidase
MKKELPEHFKKFLDKYPDIWEAHQKMTEASAECGPLDRKTRELIKVAASAAAGLETPVERHAIMAVQDGATEDEVFQTIMQLVTIVGFPRASAALKWAERALTGGD